MKTLLKGLIAIIILMFAGIGFAYLVSSRPQPEPIAVVERAWTVAVRQIKITDHEPEIVLFGRIQAPEITRLSAAIVANVLSSIKVKEGQPVKKGQPLIELDMRETELAVRQRNTMVAETRAQIEAEKLNHQNNLQIVKHEETLLELVRAQVVRARSLSKALVGSRAQLDLARQDEERQILAVENRRFNISQHASNMAQLDAQLTRNKALLELANLNMQRTKINAPFNGKVFRVHVAAGDRVRAGDQLIELYDNHQLEIKAQIPLHHLPRIRYLLETKSKLNATANVDGRRFTAVLSRFSTQVELGDVGEIGIFKIVEGGSPLTLGRVTEITLKLPLEKGVIALPSQALYGTNTIYTVQLGRLQALSVERVGVIEKSDNAYEFLLRSAELVDGAMVVVNQLPNAINDLRVKPLLETTSIN